MSLVNLERDGAPRAAAPDLPAEHLDSTRLAWDAVAHEAGRLLGITRTADVVDAVVVTAAEQTGCRCAPRLSHRWPSW